MIAPPQINKSGDAATFTVIATTRPAAPATADLVKTLRTYVIPQATHGTNLEAFVGVVRGRTARSSRGDQEATRKTERTSARTSDGSGRGAGGPAGSTKGGQKHGQKHGQKGGRGQARGRTPKRGSGGRRRG